MTASPSLQELAATTDEALVASARQASERHADLPGSFFQLR
jgi:hypothetical protein